MNLYKIHWYNDIGKKSYFWPLVVIKYILNMNNISLGKTAPLLLVMDFTARIRKRQNRNVWSNIWLVGVIQSESSFRKMVTMWVCGSSSVWLKGNMFWFPTRWFLKWSICSGSERFYYNCVFKLSFKSTLLARERTLISWNTILEARCSNNCVTVTFVLLTASGPELGCDVFADLADVFQREFVQHSSNLLWVIRDYFGGKAEWEVLQKNLGPHDQITSLSSSWAKSDSASLVIWPPPPR